MESIRLLQGYGYFAMIVFLVFMLYGYIYHLYKSEKDGVRDYEKYAKMALDDDISDIPVEQKVPQNSDKDK
jgi:cytochrome c oxidase cbb3-type subunit 4